LLPKPVTTQALESRACALETIFQNNKNSDNPSDTVVIPDDTQKLPKVGAG
jgi:hypothetical protein